MKKLLVALLSTFILLLSAPAAMAESVNLYLFHSETCPHCKDEIKFLNKEVKDGKTS